MHSKAIEKFLGFLKSFPEQIKESIEIVKNAEINFNKNNIKNVYFCGMGGSAFSGNLFLNLYGDQMDIPFQIHSGYHIPKCIDSNSLVIVSSYSGNTEETLSSFSEAKKKKAKILAITSGGELAKEMGGKNTLLLPEGFPPRQALGFAFFSLIRALSDLGFISVNQEDIAETISVTKKLARHNDPDNHDHKHFAQTFAQSLHHKIPIIYADDYSCGTLAVRFRNQLNENSKILAFSNTFPELNHNEIVGYEMESELLKNFIFVFLRHPEKEEVRIQQRIELTKTILRNNSLTVMELFPEGKSRLAKAFSLLYRVDWVTFYLALLNNKNPMDIKNIDFLKNELAKLKES